MKTDSCPLPSPLIALLAGLPLAACGSTGDRRPAPSPPSAPTDPVHQEPSGGAPPAAHLDGIGVAPDAGEGLSDEEEAEQAARLVAAIDARDRAAVEAALPGTNLEIGIGAGDEGSGDRTPLIHAVITGDVELVALLVRAGARIDGTDDAQHTPLMYATLTEDLAMARALVALGARCDAADAEGNVAWSYAAEGSDLEAFLEQAMTRANELLAALAEGRLDDAFAAVDAGASPDTNDGESCLLAAAIRSGEIAHVERALNAGARVGLLLIQGFVATTPLSIAADEGSLLVLKRLLATKPLAEVASMALPDAAGTEQPDRLQRVELLLAAGADPNTGYGLTSPALARAAAIGDLDVMRRLARAGSDSLTVDYAYINATEAPLERRMKAIEILEAMGADPDNEVLFSNALACAAETADEFLVRHLYSRATTETANGALRAAAGAGNVANLRLLHRLLGDQVDFTVSDAFHPPALILAAREGQVEAVRVLVELGVDVNQSGADLAPDSALLTAVRTENPEMVRALIALGADPDREYTAPFGGATTARAEATERENADVLAALRGE